MWDNLRWKTRLHLMPPTGWLNDPNGLCQFNGIYHVFFQYCPEDAGGKGKIGWGHYTSPDLISWTFKGMALKPDQYFDRDGVYSGSALIDGTIMRLYYTGNVKHPGEFDYTYSGREANVVLVESQDGMIFGEKELLLHNGDYPSHCTCHVRDPKVWWDKDNYYMVLGARFSSLEDAGTDYGGVLLYQSADGRCWNYCNMLTSQQIFGYMWECPDIVSVGGIRLLSVSPQGLKREKYRFQNVYQSGYFIVTGEITQQYGLCEFKEWDMGFDFYAPQTFCDEQGRRILIGWMGLPDIEDEYRSPTVQDGWQHVLTIPRELFINEAGAVCQRPVAEFDTLRRKSYTIENHNTIQVNVPFELIVKPGSAETSDEDTVITLYDGLQIGCSPSREEYWMTFISSPDTQILGYGRSTRFAKIPAKTTEIRMICDTSAVEVFFGNGETVMSTRIYPKAGTPGTVTVEGGSGCLWEMDGLEIK